MILSVRKTSFLNGQVLPPSSKSQSVRGMIFSLLAKGKSTLINPLDSDDMRDAIRVCSQLGATISLGSNELTVQNDGLPLKAELSQINTGNSGIMTRFIMPILGLRQNTEQPIVLDCGEQMRARPINSLVNALRALGLTIQYINQEGKLPVTISGRLKGGSTEVDGISSQYLSALLISLPCAANDSVITVNNLHDRPYVEMTLNWLKEQNIHYSHDKTTEYDMYRIQGKQHYKPFQSLITGDFSTASYFIAAAALIPGNIELSGLDMQDPQGDKRLVTILQEMGADITTTPHGLIIQGGRALTGIKIDANDIPDLLPTLAVVGTYAKGKTEIMNVRQARLKETDRIHSMSEGLSRLGARVEEYPDGMTVYQSTLRGAVVKGYNDHRTVMALAIAGLLGDGLTLISDSEAISKTCPTFVSLMNSLDAKMEVQNEHYDD